MVKYAIAGSKDSRRRVLPASTTGGWTNVTKEESPLSEALQEAAFIQGPPFSQLASGNSRGPLGQRVWYLERLVGWCFPWKRPGRWNLGGRPHLRAHHLQPGAHMDFNEHDPHGARVAASSGVIPNFSGINRAIIGSATSSDERPEKTNQLFNELCANRELLILNW
jgi:hypothetical protein